MRPTLSCVLAIAVLCAATAPATALERVEHGSPFFRHTVLSGYAGGGVPVGQFSSSRVGDGNHESGAFDWSVDLEHFFAPRWSLGLTLANTTYRDKDDSELETHLSSFGGFFRYLLTTERGLNPYLRFGAGGQTVQFQDPRDRFRSNAAWTVQGGGGVVAMVFRNVSVNVQAMYNHGFTENTRVPAASTADELIIVGFDTQYWTFHGGVSLYFR